MFQHMKSKMKKNLRSRILILVIVFLILGGFLIQRLFVLQIIRGEDYENNFTMQIKKKKCWMEREEIFMMSTDIRLRITNWFTV